MKIRNGFVTNSSSSSYVVAMKGGTLSKEDIDREIEHLNPIVKAIIKSALNASSAIFDEYRRRISTEEELRDFIVDNYGYGDFDTFDKIMSVPTSSARRRYEKYAPLIQKGYSLYWLQVSYHDEELANIIHTMCNGEDAILLEVDD